MNYEEASHLLNAFDQGQYVAPQDIQEAEQTVDCCDVMDMFAPAFHALVEISFDVDDYDIPVALTDVFGDDTVRTIVGQLREQISEAAENDPEYVAFCRRLDEKMDEELDLGDAA